MRTKNNDEIDT